MGDFQTDVAFTIAREGGATVTNFPWDPGGLTKFGISQRAYPKLDIKGLTLEQAEAIYQRDYWLPAGADALQEPLALNVFDAAVNMGVGRAHTLLAGPRVSLPSAADAYLWARIAYYTDLVIKNPKKAVSLAGWIKRCLLVRQVSGSA